MTEVTSQIKHESILSFFFMSLVATQWITSLVFSVRSTLVLIHKKKYFSAPLIITTTLSSVSRKRPMVSRAHSWKWNYRVSTAIRVCCKFINTLPEKSLAGESSYDILWAHWELELWLRYSADEIVSRSTWNIFWSPKQKWYSQANCNCRSYISNRWNTF